MRPAVAAVLVLLAVQGLVAVEPAPAPVEALPAESAAAPAARAGAAPKNIRAPFSGWDDDGVDVPFDRCPDRGRRNDVDDAGCPIDPAGPYGDLDRDGLLNGADVALRPGGMLARSLAAKRIVHGVAADGHLVFLGERSAGTDPLDPNTDRLDLLGDGLEAAMRHGLLDAARPGPGGRVLEPDGPRADPRAPDDYIEVRPARVDGRVFWNEALESALRAVVEDDSRPEANATYAPPPVRLHVFVEEPVDLRSPTLTLDRVFGRNGTAPEVAPNVTRARDAWVTYVVVAPRVEWGGQELSGLAYRNWVLVAVEPKGFEACEGEGGRPEAPSCRILADLFRGTLNHERMHRWGLADTHGGDDLMSSAPGVRTPRPHESRARFDYLEANPQLLVRAG